VRPLPQNWSGWLGSDGVRYSTLEDYLVAEVRERYALGRITDDELPAAVEAALNGDHEGATGSPFLPVQVMAVYS
jgi:hypothetical protein